MAKAVKLATAQPAAALQSLALSDPPVNSSATLETSTRSLIAALQDLTLSAPPAITPITPFTFHLSPTLPSELRLKIYKHMSPGPRTVHFPFPKTSTSYLDSSATIPVLLHLSREAREEAMRTYKLCFDYNHGAGGIWFAPGLDTPRFGRGQFFEGDSTSLTSCRLRFATAF